MKSANNNRLLLPIIKWLARIWGGLAAAFLIFMYIAHVLSSWSFLPSGSDALPFIFFPIGVAVGLVIAMKWAGLGGSITFVSMIAWHLIMYTAHGEPDIEPMIDGLAAPSLLFLVAWLLSRRHSRE